MHAEYFKYCETTPEIRMAAFLIPGVSPVVPFNGGLHSPAAKIIPESITKITELFGSKLPNVVVLNSNYWDLARFWLHLPHNLTQNYYEPSYLAEWMANFTCVVEQFRTLLTKAKLYYHTIPLFDFNESTGLDIRNRFGKAMLQAQLNAAGREASRRLGVHIIDIETMLAGFPVPYYLHDHHRTSDQPYY